MDNEDYLSDVSELDFLANDDTIEDDYEQNESKQSENKPIESKPVIPNDLFDDKQHRCAVVKNEPSEKEIKEKQELIAYLSRLKNHYQSKLKYDIDKLDKMDINKLKSLISKSENIIMSGSATSTLDSIFHMSNKAIDIGMGMILSDLKGISKFLDNDQSMKDAFNLIILKRFNVGGTSPEARYLFGIIMAASITYRMNSSKKSSGDNNIDNNNVINSDNNVINSGDNNNNNINIPAHILKAEMEANKDL